MFKLVYVCMYLEFIFFLKFLYIRIIENLVYVL